MSLNILARLIGQKECIPTGLLSPGQKKFLWEVMARYGATQGFSYRRFFKEGFKTWEIMGIEKVKSEFLGQYPDVAKLLDQMVGGETRFYEAIRSLGLRKEFLSYMSKLEMGVTQTYMKFRYPGESSFRPYERIGLDAIIREYIREVDEKNVV